MFFTALKMSLPYGKQKLHPDHSSFSHLRRETAAIGSDFTKHSGLRSQVLYESSTTAATRTSGMPSERPSGCFRV
jgi:hypothetical protein